MCVFPPSAGVLIAFIFPGLLGASLEEDITESAAARRSRGCASQLAWLTAAGGRLPACLHACMPVYLAASAAVQSRPLSIV